MESTRTPPDEGGCKWKPARPASSSEEKHRSGRTSAAGFVERGEAPVGPDVGGRLGGIVRCVHQVAVCRPTVAARADEQVLGHLSSRLPEGRRPRLRRGCFLLAGGEEDDRSQEGNPTHRQDDAGKRRAVRTPPPGIAAGDIPAIRRILGPWGVATIITGGSGFRIPTRGRSSRTSCGGWQRRSRRIATRSWWWRSPWFPASSGSARPTWPT